MSLQDAILSAAINGDVLSPQISESVHYKHWVSQEDEKRCLVCETHHGKIWEILETPDPQPPIHLHCRCAVELMQAIKAGTATIRGTDGADWQLKFEGQLPDYYITNNELKSLGWERGKSVSNYASGKIITKGIYYNSNGHLPQAPSRI